MIDGNTVFAVIPARGGSKRIPLKNIVPLAGKPLIAWTIETALATPEIDRVIVSTDHDQIADTAYQYGAKVMKRPVHLAQDDSLPVDVIRDLLERWRKEGNIPKYTVYLEPTNPLRRPKDIQRCLKMLHNDPSAFDSVATFKKADIHPYKTWRIQMSKPSVFVPEAQPWVPQQQLEPVYQMDGTVYCFVTNRLDNQAKSVFFGNIGALVIPSERSIDINETRDLLIAETLLKERNL
ncbi:acylneuraminate cytidylyltransferase family protein [Desmospora profundinema]|uniref:CMP-N-acetylneuraminic acid synthetase n=1 Tax=Desmospora profundinema TaxID=1571184 RepID=A0ABU1IS28_9BACL|nr:acylneuraminate cytidylyltransferase family protein [Desmospora profundinema]MDR6227496.1 CMP-N-acetylneuraminic acid synthetase [Desmospora profundinema]